MKKIFSKFFFAEILICSISACSKSPGQPSELYGMVDVSIVASISENSSTKTSYDADNHLALWKREDMVGVIAGYGNGLFTDARMQDFKIEDKNRIGDEFLSSATFSGKLKDKGSQTYTYYVVHPYTAFMDVTDASSVSSRLEERQYPDLKSWDGSCDMLASKPVTVTSSSVASDNLQVRFARLFGILRLRFSDSITSVYSEETVEYISIASDNDNDRLAGKFTVNLASDEAPDPVFSSSEGEYFNEITLDYRGRNAKLSDIDAYFVLNPGAYSNVTITISTSEHTLTLHRTDLTVKRGQVASASLSWQSSDVATPSESLLPRNPETLKVFVFGHSYVQNSFSYINALLNDAKIKNVTFANLFISDCSLKTYWEHSQNEGNTKGGTDVITYTPHRYNGSMVRSVQTQKTIIDALCDEDWDVVVFQTNTTGLGYYDDFSQYLDNLIGYVKSTCLQEHGRIPLFGWHMFWAFGTNHGQLSAYDYNQELNYAAHVKAAKEVMRNTDIKLVIPSGTAIQSLRHSSLNDPYSGDKAHDFTWDGGHADDAGCYTSGCTWFEFFLKPCFGKTVTGNNYIPAPGAPGVHVTPSNKEVLQRAAVLACQNPFEISHLDTVNPYDVGGSIETFNLIDNLTW